MVNKTVKGEEATALLIHIRGNSDIATLQGEIINIQKERDKGNKPSPQELIEFDKNGFTLDECFDAMSKLDAFELSKPAMELGRIYFENNSFVFLKEWKSALPGSK
jgi:hypothetical protein